jgi:general secretion pathway protein H
MIVPRPDVAQHPCARRAATPGRSHGLSLLELLIVLAIIAIIATFALPVLGPGVSGTALKSAAREVAAGLRMARSEAVAGRRETVLMLDLQQRSFRVDRDPREHALPQDIEIRLFTAQSDLVSDHTGAVRFFPDGGSTGGRITLAAGERKYDVDIDWLTGRVAIGD